MNHNFFWSHLLTCSKVARTNKYSIQLKQKKKIEKNQLIFLGKILFTPSQKASFRLTEYFVTLSYTLANQIETIN